MNRSKAAWASFRVDAIQMSCSIDLALAWTLFSSLLSTLAVLCTQQRCTRVVGKTWRGAFQNPRAPSPVARSGAMESIARAGVLVYPDGYPTLDVGSSPEVKNRFIQLDSRLQKAA